MHPFHVCDGRHGREFIEQRVLRTGMVKTLEIRKNTHIAEKICWIQAKRNNVKQTVKCSVRNIYTTAAVGFARDKQETCSKNVVCCCWNLLWYSINMFWSTAWLTLLLGTNEWCCSRRPFNKRFYALINSQFILAEWLWHIVQISSTRSHSSTKNPYYLSNFKCITR